MPFCNTRTISHLKVTYPGHRLERKVECRLSRISSTHKHAHVARPP